MSEREWQDIETAPHDGTPILGWVPEEFFVKALDYVIAVYRNYQWVREGDDYDLVVTPTHWMPLPPPPSSIKEE